MNRLRSERTLEALALAGALWATLVASVATARAEDPLNRKDEAAEITVQIDPAIAAAPEFMEAVRTEAESIASLFARDASEAFASLGKEPGWKPYSLKLIFRGTFISTRMASAVGEATDVAGGEEPSTTFVNLTMDRQTGDTLEMADLFGDYGPTSPAFLAVQAYVRDRLEVERAARLDIGDLPPEDYEWVLDGTKEPALLSTFAVKPGTTADKAGGLLLEFPPYQVGSYEEGSYELELPTLLISEYLKPEYRDLFE